MTENSRLLKRRIQVLRNGADLSYRGVAGCTGARVPSPRSDARRYLASGDALPAGYRIRLRGAVRYAWQRATGFGALQPPFRQNRIITGHFNIEIVLQRERNGILH